VSTQRPDVSLERYDHMDRVETSDGEYRVLVSARTGERQLVNADIVEYDSALEHPAAGGLAGFLGILAVLVAPVAGGLLLGEMLFTGTVPVVGSIFAGLLVGIVASNICLEKTTLGDWLWRFLEWYDVKHLVLRGDGE